MISLTRRNGFPLIRSAIPSFASWADRFQSCQLSGGRGSSLASTYGFLGSEQDLLSLGLISAGFPDPLKAQVLLYALPARGISRAKIAATFLARGMYGQP